MIRYTLGNKRTLGAIGASLLVLASLPASADSDWLSSQLRLTDGYEHRSSPSTGIRNTSSGYVGASMTEFRYPDAQENARNLLSRPLVTGASAEVPEIEQLAPVEQPDAFRQAMILLGH
jgi:hypothetical protein